jgi:hypothetical protein
MGTTIHDLPVELWTHIAKSCVQYNNHDSSDFPLRTNCQERMTWVTVSRSAKTDICNIRLVCKQFRSAAYESFGTILGRRRFRLTRVGREDLRAISRNGGLAPWVRALTFGSAILFGPKSRYWESREERIEPKGESARLEIEEHLTLVKDAYLRAAKKDWDWLADAQTATRELAAILDKFKNLEKIRVIVTDKTEYLAGWLPPEAQTDFIESRCEYNPFLPEYEGNQHYNPQNHAVPQRVVSALAAAQIKIKDLRFSDQYYRYVPLAGSISIPLSTMASTLKTLRIPVSIESGTDRGFFALEGNHMLVLSSFTALEDLALTTMSTGLYEDNIRLTESMRMMSDNVFASLQHTSQLRRFALDGDWLVSGASLIACFKHHEATLRSLILYHVILNEPWLPTLQTMADMIACNKLEFLSIQEPRENFDDWPAFSGFSNLVLPSFDCRTHFDGDRRWDHEGFVIDENKDLSPCRERSDSE